MQFWLMSMGCQRFPLDGSPGSWLTTRNGPDLIFQDIFVSLRGWTWFYLPGLNSGWNVGPSLRSRIQKKQSMQWKHPGSPPPKKFISREDHVFIFYCQEIFMIDYLEQGSTINDTYYAGELRRLRQEIARKRSANCLNAFYSCTKMCQLTHPKLRWLLELIAAWKIFPIPHIRFWLLPVSET
jgi:hypothetical protein